MIILCHEIYPLTSQPLRIFLTQIRLRPTAIKRLCTLVCRSVDLSVGLSVTHLFDDPNGEHIGLLGLGSDLYQNQISEMVRTKIVSHWIRHHFTLIWTSKAIATCERNCSRCVMQCFVYLQSIKWKPSKCPILMLIYLQLSTNQCCRGILASGINNVCRIYGWLLLPFLCQVLIHFFNQFCLHAPSTQ